MAGAKLSVPFPDLHNVDMGQGSYLRMLPFVVPSSGHALSRPLSHRKTQLAKGKKPASRGDQRLLTGKHTESNERPVEPRVSLQAPKDLGHAEALL